MESKDSVANRTWKEWAQVQCNYLVRTRHLAKGIMLFWRPLVGVTDLHLILKYKLLAKSSQKNNVRVSFRALREQRHTHCLFLCSVAEVSKQKRKCACFWQLNFSQIHLLTLSYIAVCIYFAKIILILHTGMTPLPSRLACQSTYHLFTYNMFHIFFANIASGVLV